MVSYPEWEYKTFKNVRSVSLEQVLKTYGADGWELCAVIPSDPVARWLTIVFKRPA